MSAVATETRMRLVPIADLLQACPPTWLMRGLFETESLVVLYGEPGAGKSFITLDWALCVATGRPWQGRAVSQRPVIYVAGEGARGLGRRARAWLTANSSSETVPVFFILDGLQLLDDKDSELLRTRIMSMPGALIIFDTYAQCFNGDENSAKETGDAIRALRPLLREHHATVLLVHHTGKQRSAGERGSNALRGAADTMIELKKSGDVITIRCTKQKDDEPFEPIQVCLQQVSLGELDEEEKALTSCVVVERDGAAAPDLMGDGPQVALDVLAAHPGGLPSGMWKTELSERRPFKGRTFYNWLHDLLQRGLVEKVQGTKDSYRAVCTSASAT